MNHSRLAYWIVTILVACAFLITGIGDLLPFEHIARDMVHLGYPPYVKTILGFWKILAALTLFMPVTQTLREWAYAGMLFDLTGAAYSRFSVGDHAILVLIPVLIASLVILSRWLKLGRGNHHARNANPACHPSGK